jgi:hypothetical protein
MFAVSCSAREAARTVRGTGEVQAPVVKVPNQILGLRVAPEDVSKQVKNLKRPYLDSVGLFSLREGDLLRATLQISRFNGLAKPNSPQFRASVIGLTGASRAQELRVGDIIVYSTTGSEQNVFIWFKERGLFVLSVHRDYEFPRTLLRRAVDLPIQL